MRTKLKNMMTNATGIKDEKDFDTFCGTESGILIFQPIFSVKRMISIAMIEIKIPTNNPAAPKFPNGIPIPKPSSAKACIGVTTKKDANAAKVPAILSKP